MNAPDGTGFAPSAAPAAELGFGCSGLMARLDRRASRRLLEAAFEAGVTHFDTARSYGYGEAEAVLGEFALGRRQSLRLVTKLGILPPRSSAMLRAARLAVRGLAAAVPAARGFVRRRSGSLVSTGCFTAPQMRASLEASLRALRVPCVDMLLLHDCTLGDLLNDEVQDFMAGAMARGEALACGLATDAATTRQAAAQFPDAPLTGCLQFASGVLEDAIGWVAPPAGCLVITHSSIRLDLARLRYWVGCDAARARCWSEAFGFDLADGDGLGLALMAFALVRNPGGVALFSSKDAGRIARYAALGAEPARRTALAARVRDLAEAYQRATAAPDETEVARHVH